MSADRDAMYAHFEQSPGDLTAYGAVADLLDGEGNAVLAHAFWWMHYRAVWPHRRSYYAPKSGFAGRKVPKRFAWAWYAERVYHGLYLNCPGVLPKAPLHQHALPELVIRSEQQVFASHLGAVTWLANRLMEFARLLACDPGDGTHWGIEVPSVRGVMAQQLEIEMGGCPLSEVLFVSHGDEVDE